MKKRFFVLILLSLLLIIAFPGVSTAKTVTEKVARTGILTVSTRLDLIPYSYINDKKELVGYTIDIINLIKEQLAKQLNKEITLQIVPEKDFNDRINQIESGQVDLACNTAFTWERDQYVDFSTSYSVSGIRLLVKNDSNLGSVESLSGKKIGVQANTIAEKTIKLIQPEVTIVSSFKNIEEGFASLDKGEIDALAGDTIILAGLSQKINPDAYKIVPEYPYARYGVACIVSENNSGFLNLVNYAIVKLMQGYLIEDEKSLEIINQWFGPQGIVEIDPKVIREFFEFTIMTHEQIPLVSLEKQKS